jgi:hypothetical protein
MMDILLLMEISATIFVLGGVWLIGNPHILGIWLMFVAQTIWFIYAMKTDQYFLAIQSLILFLFNTRALINWRKKGVG